MKLFTGIFLGLLVLSIYFIPVFGFHQAFAQDKFPPPPQNIKLENPLGSTKTLGGLLDKIIDWLVLKIGPVIATLMVIVGALFILFAGGDEEKFKTGKKIILYTAIGYGIIIIGSGIEKIITKLLNS